MNASEFCVSLSLPFNCRHNDNNVNRSSFYNFQTFFNEFYLVGNFLENDENINLPSFDKLVDKVYPDDSWRVLVKTITRECYREVELVDTTAANSDPCKKKIFQFDDCLVANIVIVSSLIFK